MKPISVYIPENSLLNPTEEAPIGNYNKFNFSRRKCTHFLKNY